MATGHSSTSSENRASQSFNQDHIDDLLAHYAGLSQGSHEGRGFLPPLRSQAREEVPDYNVRGQESPRHFSAAVNYFPPAPARLETGGNIVSTSWDDVRGTAAEEAPSNYPTTAAEILDLLPLKLAYLSGGRDKEGLPIITFPSPPKSYVYNRDDIRRVVQYLASVPTEEIRQGGFCVILDGRTSNWHTSKQILRALQEALPGQIHVVYIVEPARFWGKTKAAHGHNKEKGKLEFTTVMVPDTKLTRYIEPNQLTEDLGGFLPYNHEQWIKLRQDLEHFISSFNALMEHNSRVEQQLQQDQPVQDLESAEDVLSRHTMLQDQFKKAPQSTVREANDLLRSLEQGRDVAGTSSFTPDKINAVSVIKKLLDNIARRQQQLDDLWRTKKTSLEQALQLQVFEKSMQKVRNWLKTRGEETLASWTDIGTNQESARNVQEQHARFEAKATSILNILTQLRRMVDRLNGSNHFAADSLQKQVAKVSNRFSRFEEHLAQRKKIVEASVVAHTSVAEWSGRCKEASGIFKEEATATDLAMVELLLGEHMERMHQLGELASRASSDAGNLLRLLESVNSAGGESQLAQATKTGPQYSLAIDHIHHLLENVEVLRKRLYELAEARKLRLEQYKQLFLCERDADQVTGLMIEMLNQVLSASGEVGNSLQNVLRLLDEHCKFSDSAKKTYKYACDLLTTAQRSRKALKMDSQVNDGLLTNVTSTWERLGSALQDSQACLEMSQQFHTSLEEVLTRYSRWTTPINQMPRSSDFAEILSQEIENGREEWKYKAEECLEMGKVLLAHLQQPHPQANSRPSEVLKRSQCYVKFRMEEVEARTRESSQALDYHLGVLKDFATYCGFELGIEQVLMWLQSQGLKTIQSLPRLGDTESAVREQLASFDKFNNTCMELTKQVQQLYAQSAQTEAIIQCFSSELVKKATSLKTVWEKFLARVVEWHDTLRATLKLYELISMLQTLLGELQSSLSAEAVSKQQGRGLEAYLGPPTAQRQRLLSLASTLPLVRSALMKHQSVEHSIDTVTNIDRQLKAIEAQRACIEELWQSAVGLLENEKVISRQLDTNGLVKHRDPLVAKTGDKIPVVKSGDKKDKVSIQELEPVVKSGDQSKVGPLVESGDQSKGAKATTVLVRTLSKPSDEPRVKVSQRPDVESGEGVRKFSLGSKPVEKPRAMLKLKATLSNDALERSGNKENDKRDLELCTQLTTRTHKVLEWLEVECDGFLANNTQMGNTLETAEKLKTLYERFLESIQPSCLELSHAISELLSLKSHPSVAQSVGETCIAVRDSVGKRRMQLQERIEILQTFVSFCSLSQEIESKISKMNELFSCELDLDSASNSAQRLLDEYSPIVQNITEAYPRCKDQGDRFMGAASPLLTRRGEPSKLSVSSACTLVAMQLGELEGEYQLVLLGWGEKEGSLKQAAEWHSFKSSVEQLTNWLTDPGTFLSDQTEFGTSVATAEDLLMEHNEFETGAQRIASEVEALLSLPERYLASPHHHIAAAGLSRKAQELKALHNSFKARTSARHQGLLKSVAFFQGVEKLASDMENTVKLVREGNNEAHGSLRLASAIARHAALVKEGETLIKMAATAGSLVPHEQETRSHHHQQQPSDPHKQVIRQTLEGLKAKLDLYREVVEGRQSSSSLSQGSKALPVGGGKRQVSELVIQQKTSSPGQIRKEGVSIASSPGQVRKEGVSIASSPGQVRKEGVSIASSPGQVRKGNMLVAASPPPQVKKEEAAKGLSPMHVTAVSGVDTKTWTSSGDAKFSVCLSVPLRASFSTLVTRDLPMRVPRPTLLPPLETSTSEHVTTTRGGASLLTKPILLATPIGSQKAASTSVSKATLTKHYSLDLTSESGGNVERNQRETTPPVCNQREGTPLSGKVSCLRSIFNAMTTNSTPSPQPQTQSRSSRAKSTPPPQTQTQSLRAKSTPPSLSQTQSQSLWDTSTSFPVRCSSPDIIPMVRRLSPNNAAPPRPPSPLNYNPNVGGSGLLESDCDSLSTFASSADEEREEEEEVVVGVEETDNDGRGQAESKKTRSVGIVLLELKHTEQSYLNSLSVLAEGYLPRFNDQHLPTFLVGKREALLANIDQIYNLHRSLSQVFTDPGSSLLDVCQCFIGHAEGFSCYIPYLSNLLRGLMVLSEYGGTFFEECQQDLRDTMTLEDQCMQPRERLVEYWTLFCELLACAQKECLHTVAAVKDVLCIFHRVTRAVDNAMAAGSLRDWPFAVRPEGVVRRELFHVYKPTKKKKMKEVLVVLHHDHVIFAQLKPKASWRDMATCEFVDSLDAHSLMLIETYKQRKERFALSNHLGKAESIFVLQPVLKNTMVKQLWIRDICQLLGTTPVEALPELGVQHELLPLFFRTPPLPGGEDSKEGSKNGSIGRRDSKRMSSLKRRVSGKEVNLTRIDSKKRGRLDEKEQTLPLPPVANVQLATFPSGVFRIAPTQPANNMYVVVQPYLSHREGFLSVREGQLVEVLQRSGPNWLVMTVARPGEIEEEEGFLPASCLKRVGEGLPNSEAAGVIEGPGHQGVAENEKNSVESPLPGEALSLHPPEPVYYVKESIDPHTTPGLTLERGQAVQVLDSSDARWWLVRNRDTMEEGMVAPSCLSRFPTNKLDGGSSVDDLLSETDKKTPLGAIFGNHDPAEIPPRTPEGVFSEVSSPTKGAATPCSTSEMSLKRTTPIPDLSLTQGTLAFMQPRPLGRSASFSDLWGGRWEGGLSTLERKKAVSRHSLPGSLATLELLTGEEPVFIAKGATPLSSSLQGSEVNPSLNETHGGRDQPVFIAVAHFTPSEKSSIPLVEGQEVKVIDASRPDWWLVHCLNTSKEGWVPATYLKERGGHQGLLLSEDVYRFPFLASAGRITPEALTPQKNSMTACVVTCDHRAEQEGQLTLTKGQKVHVMDSKRSDWWLCSTTISGQSVTGWVRGQNLIPCIDISENGIDLPKSTVPLCVALADCPAKESGTMAIGEGEVLEMIDNSRHDWCLVRRTNFKEPSEGWVKSSFIRDCSKGENRGGTLTVPWHTRTGSNESDMSDQYEPQLSSMCLSPETNVEPYEDESQRKEALEKRDCVLSELLRTEKEYVEKLEYCVENYWRPMGDVSQPKALRGAQDVIFGNLVDIYKFHHDTFQHELIKCQEEPLLLGDTFVEAQGSLQMYVSYCQSKSRALEAYREFISFFEDLRSQIRGRLELPDYLILPVQRITKYTLLLQDFHKYSTRAGIQAGKIELALDVTRGISASANAAVHLSMLEGQDKLDLGPLVLQDTFGVQEGPKPFKERRAFLFKKGLIITRRKRDSSEKESYVVKDQLMLSDISITQDMDKAKRNFIIYHKTTGTKFTLRAMSSSIKVTWLQKANDLIKEMKGARPARPKSASGSLERLAKSPSFLGSKSSRETSQRKSVRTLKVPQANEESAPAGTKYVVMECIVMEGGDDVTLEPGDEVELVRMDGSGSLRVKTLDDSHSIEGNVPGNYLRRKDSIITGISMAAAPRFTMNLSDLHLLYGTTATISCAFNGYPPPSVCWKHEDEPILSNTPHIKMTSCPTSSVLEVVSLDYEDMGFYSCYITNSMGSVHTSMTLSMYGPPSQPPKPTVSNIHSNSVKLRWGPPEYDGTSSITSYEIESLQSGFGEWHQIAQNSRNSYVVKTLEQNTSYLFRIVAINEFGASKPSDPSERVLTKAKGWLVSSPSINKKSVHPESGKDMTDFAYDECDDGVNGAFSPPFPDFGSNPPPQSSGSNTRLSRRESFVNHFIIQQDELGRGRFGIVYKCIDRQTNQIFAAKHVRIRIKRKAEIRSEVDILKTVAGISPHILELQGAFEKDRVLHIVTELVPDGELLDQVIAENSLTERVAVFYLSQLLQGLRAIHRLNIAHLDVKPENLMLSGPVLKIIDFGCAKNCGANMVPPSISNSLPEFLAPEMVNQDPVTPAMDMWSVGVITYVLLTGISPFFADNLHKTAEKIRDAKYSSDETVFEQISPEAKDFIQSLLQKSPENRYNANEALEHMWIRMLNTGSPGPASSSPWPMPRLDITHLKNFVARRKRQAMVTAVENNYIFGQRQNSTLLSPSPMESEEVVLAAPVLWGGPADLKLMSQVGTSLSIEWHFGGSPTPTVVWEHNQRRITPSDRLAIHTEGEVTSMTITNVVRSDEGNYMCCVMNSVGVEARKVLLTVQDKPSPPTAVTAIRLSGNTALVSWQPPSYVGNTPVHGYTLERQRVGLGTWESATGEEEVLQSVAQIVENLSPDAAYLFRVAAINQVGTSPFSEPASLVVKADSGGDSESSTFEDQVCSQDNTKVCSQDSTKVCSQDSTKEQSFDAMYEVKQVLSCGAFSIVSKCVHRTSGATFVAKCISFSLGESVVMTQFQIHQQSTHTRIVTLVEFFETDRDMTMVLEYLPGGNLAGHVREGVVLSEMESSRFTRQILEGLQYLHKSNIIHCNIRPDNVLLNGSRSELKLTDFRLSRSITPTNQFEAIPQEPDFMAPEAVELKSITPSADIWSVGVLILFMLLGKSLLLGCNEKETVANIRACQLYKRKSEITNISQSCKDFLIEKVLARNPRKRIPASECLTNQWL